MGRFRRKWRRRDGPKMPLLAVWWGLYAALDPPVQSQAVSWATSYRDSRYRASTHAGAVLNQGDQGENRMYTPIPDPDS